MVFQKDVDRGQWLVAQAAAKDYLKNQFKAELYFLTAAEGGLDHVLQNGFQRKVQTSLTMEMTMMMTTMIQMLCSTWTQLARVSLGPGKELVMPGEVVAVGLSLLNPMPLLPGARFTLRTKENTIAAGVVSEILPLNEALSREHILADAGKETPADTTFAE